MPLSLSGVFARKLSHTSLLSRDLFAGLVLFLATAAFILWQNTHLAVLWDASYTLETSTRIALGQVPYRDFPLAHAPLTFLLQAVLIRLTGRAFWHHVLYAAVAGGVSTVLAWRLTLATLKNRTSFAWIAALALSAPLVFLGVYCILPFPSYDCDATLSVLFALWLWRKMAEKELAESIARPFFAGAALAIPLFFKQNIGLPFLLAGVALLCLLMTLRFVRREPVAPLLSALAGAASMLAVSLFLLHATVGLGNYFHWTIAFAAQRRLHGLESLREVFSDPSLLWQFPCVAAGILLLCLPIASRRAVRLAALLLLAAPFLWVLIGLFLSDDDGDRAVNLLALWPVLLVLSFLLALVRFFRAPGLGACQPFLVLAAIGGALLSQQLWGSTYALWPLLVLLLADLLAALSTVSRSTNATPAYSLAPPLAAIVSAVLLVAGGLYAVSEERLSYVQIDDGALEHATVPALRGLALRGAYLPEFEELLRFAAAEIPPADGLILLPGEDPFYFATGRAPRFPVLLFDPATDPLSPAQLAAEARSHNIHWLIVKRHLQIKEDPTPARAAALDALKNEFHLYRTLRGYEVYRRVE